VLVAAIKLTVLYLKAILHNHPSYQWSLEDVLQHGIYNKNSLSKHPPTTLPATNA